MTQGTNIPLLPSSLMSEPWIAAFDKLIRNYISNGTDLSLAPPIPESVITILNIDTAETAVLPYLAWMFGVDGYKGFDFATTELQQRNMIKNAMIKHERHGTLWTLRTALEDAGYQNIIIDDHLYVQFLDGSWILDGTYTLDSNYWADFSVTLNPPVGVTVNQIDIPGLIIYINYWKRASSRLVDLTLSDIVFTNLTIGGGTGPHYLDGSWLLDGSIYLDGV